MQSRAAKRPKSDWDAIFCSWLQSAGGEAAFDGSGLLSMPPEVLREVVVARVIEDSRRGGGNARLMAALVKGLAPRQCHDFLCLLDSGAVAADVGRALMRLLNDSDPAGGEGVTRALLEGRERRCLQACRGVVQSLLFGGSP